MHLYTGKIHASFIVENDDVRKGDMQKITEAYQNAIEILQSIGCVIHDCSLLTRSPKRSYCADCQEID